MGELGCYRNLCKKCGKECPFPYSDNSSEGCDSYRADNRFPDLQMDKEMRDIQNCNKR